MAEQSFLGRTAGKTSAFCRRVDAQSATIYQILHSTIRISKKIRIFAPL